MARAPDPLPEGEEALKAALIETRAKLSGAEALIEHLQLVIAKMKREHFGPRSERSQRLLDQMELQLEELAAAAGEDEVKAETARASRFRASRGARRRGATSRLTCRGGASFTPRRRRAPAAAAAKLSKIGEDVTETLDVGAAAMVRDRARAREVHLPLLREDHAAAGAVPCDRARLCRAEPAGDDPGREVRQPSAAQPPERAI